MNKQKKEKEDRKKYLVRLAIDYIESHTGILGMEADTIYYDEANYDGTCLANDLRLEFDFERGGY